MFVGVSSLSGVSNKHAPEHREAVSAPDSPFANVLSLVVRTDRCVSAWREQNLETRSDGCSSEKHRHREMQMGCAASGHSEA